MSIRHVGRCWADILGECLGPLTDEHLVTQALFGNRVRLVGQRVPWLDTPTETSIRRLCTNMLCRGHNEELGRTADAAALRLLRALRQMNNPMTLRGSRTPRTPVARLIRGVDLGRWLCKTHCNFMVVAGLFPATDFVRYAFQHPTESRIYFYLAAQLGNTVRFGDSRDPVVSYRQLICDETADPGCQITLAGFPMIAATEALQRDGQLMIDRLRVMQRPTLQGPYRVEFDWGDDK